MLGGTPVMTIEDREPACELRLVRAKALARAVAVGEITLILSDSAPVIHGPQMN